MLVAGALVLDYRGSGLSRSPNLKGDGKDMTKTEIAINEIEHEMRLGSGDNWAAAKIAAEKTGLGIYTERPSVFPRCRADQRYLFEIFAKIGSKFGRRLAIHYISQGGLNCLDRVQLGIWPKGFRKQGRAISPDDLNRCPNPTWLNLEVCDAELLVAEWGRQPYIFEQAAAKSIKAALHAREVQITMEDLCNEED